MDLENWWIQQGNILGDINWGVGTIILMDILFITVGMTDQRVHRSAVQGRAGASLSVRWAIFL